MRFLVAYDDTQGAQAALRAAGELAKATNASLALIWVLNPLIDAAGVFAPNTREAMAQLTSETRARLAQQLAETSIEADPLVEEVRRGEDTWEAIVRAAREQGADIVAIGSRRHTGLMGAILGSVSSGVVEHSPCPVLVVRPDHLAKPLGQ